LASVRKKVVIKKKAIIIKKGARASCNGLKKRKVLLCAA